jgi:hypothetical protein
MLRDLARRTLIQIKKGGTTRSESLVVDSRAKSRRLQIERSVGEWIPMVLPAGH